MFSSFLGCAGESDYDKPRILEIAEVMQNIDSLDEGKKKQEKAIKKGKEAELQTRKLQVSLNEIRCEEQYLGVSQHHHAVREYPCCLPPIRSVGAVQVCGNGRRVSDVLVEVSLVLSRSFLAFNETQGGSSSFAKNEEGMGGVWHGRHLSLHNNVRRHGRSRCSHQKGRLPRVLSVGRVRRYYLLSKPFRRVRT